MRQELFHGRNGRLRHGRPSQRNQIQIAPTLTSIGDIASRTSSIIFSNFSTAGDSTSQLVSVNSEMLCAAVAKSLRERFVTQFELLEVSKDLTHRSTSRSSICTTESMGN